MDADGRRISWPEVSRINENEMRALMRNIVNRLYTFHLHADDPGLQAQIERWMVAASKWDAPEVDPRMMRHSGLWPNGLSVVKDSQQLRPSLSSTQARASSADLSPRFASMTANAQQSKRETASLAFASSKSAETPVSENTISTW